MSQPQLSHRVRPRKELNRPVMTNLFDAGVQLFGVPLLLPDSGRRVSLMTNAQKNPVTEQQIIDRAAAKARQLFWWKVAVLFLVVVLFLVWVTTQ